MNPFKPKMEMQLKDYAGSFKKKSKSHIVLSSHPSRQTAAPLKIKAINPKSIKFLCLLAAPEGIASFHEEHPEVPIFTAAIDEYLNEKGYIIPGLGDAGDRLYGTKLEY